MGTTLIYSTALLLVVAVATGSGTVVSSISGKTTTTTTTTTTPASKLTSVEEATVGPKSKRGVVEIGTNIWANNGGYQSKSASPSTSSATVNQNSNSYSPQRVSGSSSAYSPAQNNPRPSVYNNQNSGYRQAVPYSSVSYTIADESRGNGGQTYGNSEPSFGNTAQSYVSSPHNYGSNVQGQNSGFTALYSPQSQSTSSQSSPNFGSYHEAQPVTSSAQTQDSQSGQIQNGPINTPYYTSFASASSPVKLFNDKLTTGQYGGSLVQIPQEQQSFQKTQSMYAPNHQSAAYSIPNIGSFPYQQVSSLNQGSPYAPQGPIFAATSQIHRNTLKNSFPGLKGQEFSQTYAPHHQSASTFVPSVQTNVFSPATVDFNGKKIPLPVLQLQSAEDFPGFAQSINGQPLVLEANSPFQAQTEFSFLTDFAKSLNPQGGNILPLFNNEQPIQTNQPQVLPVRSANGSPQFPQYKGARINTAPNYNLGQPAPSYEPLNAQPQLHFSGKPAPPQSSAPLSTSSIIHHPRLNSRPTAEIRDDVEVINKKKRPSPPPHDFDEDDVDEGYKAIEREYGRQQEDAEDDGPQRGKHFKESNAESDFKPSKSFPFKSYDEQFHKYSKPSSDEDSEEEKPSSRYRYSSAEDDDDHEGYSTAHHADYRSPKARPSRYEDDGEESHRQERQEEADEDEDHPKRPSAYSSYGKDFEQEFEDSYRRELPKTKYTHVKEVPEIDEPSSSSHKSYSNSDSPSRPAKYKGRREHEHSHDEDPEESKTYSSHTSQKHGKAPKSRDNEGYSSSIRSYNKGQSPKVVHEESFGYKAPENSGYSKYKKSPSGDSYASVKKSPKMDSYLQASRSSYKSPKNDKAFENGDSYSYSSGSTWKSDKKSPESSDFHGHGSSVVKTLALPEHKSTFHAPAIGRGNFFFSRGEKMGRDLTGI